MEMDLRDYRARVTRNVCWMAVDLTLYQQSVRHGDVTYVAGLDTVTQESGMEPPEPLRISEEAAQSLMDDLWHEGFRPKDVKFSSEALQAKDDHLQDMRKQQRELLDLVLQQRRKYIVVPAGTMGEDALAEFSRVLNQED